MRIAASTAIGGAWLALLLVAAFAPGCAARASGPAESTRAALGEAFALGVGESARVEGEDAEVGLEAVVADSRCALGVQCVWEGDAVVRVWLRAGPARETVELHTARRERRAANLAGYELRLLALEPAPVAGRTTRPEDYRATLELARGAGGPDADRTAPTS
jgi:hypothetical protein